MEIRKLLKINYYSTEAIPLSACRRPESASAEFETGMGWVAKAKGCCEVEMIFERSFMAFFFIISAVLIRVLSHFDVIPHIPNFAPIAAMALFGGVYFINKRYAILIPLAAMLVADIFIGFYSPWIMASVYGSFLLIGLLGLWLKDHKTLPNIIGASLIGSVAFFLLTNFAVWAVPHSLYPHTLQGLLQSYMMGLPFFRNTLMGDLFYTGAMFGLMEIVLLVINKKIAIKKTI